MWIFFRMKFYVKVGEKMKKIIVWAVIAAMLVCVFAVSSSATDAVTGKCGDNLTWTYESGTLTITGTGDMTDYTPYLSVPWKLYLSEIKTVVIGTGATGIGASAFFGCGSLESVIIPEGVLRIGNGAFCGCSFLYAVTIPESVTLIDDYAFSDSGVSEIVIPKNVEKIGRSAFDGCDSLSKITFMSFDTEINDSMLTIYGDATVYGYDDSTAEAYAKKYNKQFVSIGKAPATTIASGTCGSGIVWRFDSIGTLTISGKGNMENYSSSGSVAWASFSDGIKYVVAETGITGIGDYSFYLCKNLRSVSLPDGIAYIGKYAFYECDALAQVKLPTSVETIGNGAFCGCDMLSEISVPGGIREIGAMAFRDCTRLKTAVIAGNPTKMGSSVFCNCESLESVSLPNNMTVIPDMTFDGCSALSEIKIPDGVTKIGKGAFGGCMELGGITLPETTSVIGEYAFEKCSGITSVFIPKNVKSIGDGSFSDCYGLTEISVDPENGYFASEDGVLFDAKKTTLIQYPEGKSNKYYSVPEGVEYIGNYAFFKVSQLMEVILSGKIRTIGDYAFSECYGLEEIIIPASVEVIGEYAFSECASLDDVIFEGNSKCAEIKKGAFENCGVLSGIYLPKSLKTLGQEAFRGCAGLSGISFESGGACENIGARAFEGTAYYKRDANWDDSVLYIGWYLIKTSDVISGIYAVKAGTVTIADEAFKNQTELATVLLPDGLAAIGESAFEGCSELSEIAIPDSVTFVGDKAFSMCGSLQNLALPRNVKNLFGNTLEGCNALISLTVKASDAVIAEGSGTVPENAVIYGYENSSAQRYAVKYGRFFSSLGESSLYPTFQQATLLLESDISIRFYLRKDSVVGADSFYVIFKKAIYDGDGNISRYITLKVTDYSEGKSASGVDCWVFTFPGIAAKEMASYVNATAYYVKNGTSYEGMSKDYSVLDYAQNQLAKSSNAKLLTMLVDLLNYGAEAQKYFGYNTSRLANANLTAEQRGYATGFITINSVKNNELLPGASMNIRQASLILEEKVKIKYYIGRVSFDGDISDLTMKIQYTSGGTQIEKTISGSLFTPAENGEYTALFDALAAKEMFVPCVATLYIGGEPVSNTVTYSVESYAASKQTDPEVAPLAVSMIRYGKSTAAFFG